MTAFGFPPSQLPAVLRQLSALGEVDKHGSFGAPVGANWVYVRFSTPAAAQRALMLDGRAVSRGVMIGVRAVDEADARRLDVAALEGGVATLRRDAAGTAKAADGAWTSACATSAPVVIPLSARTGWSKFVEYALGW